MGEIVQLIGKKERTSAGRRLLATGALVLAAVATGLVAPSVAGAAEAGPAGPPRDLAVAQAQGGVASTELTASWAAPELNGGELVDYVVSTTDRNGAEVFATTTTGTTAFTQEEYCVAPFETTVAARTRVPGSAELVVGEPASVVTPEDRECRTFVALTAPSVSPTGFTAHIEVTDGPRHNGSTCTLTVDGNPVWTSERGACSAHTLPTAFDVPVEGLAPGGTYVAQVTAVAPAGQSFTTEPVSVVTPAAG